MAGKFPNTFVPNIEGASYHPKWVKANPGEAAKWTAFRDKVLAYKKGDTVAVPSMATKYGKALVAAGQDYMSVIDLGSVWVPPEEPPPTGTFGDLLPARLPESTGATTNVSTYAALQSAVSSVANGSTINITANINGGGATWSISRVASAAAPITITSSPGVVISNFSQIYLGSAGYLRFRDLEIASALVDAMKFAGPHDIEVDSCIFRNSGGMGIMLGTPTPSRIQIWNSVFYNNGSNSNKDHGIYWSHASGTGNVLANCLFYDNYAYNVQLYTDFSDGIVTCNTIDGYIPQADARGGLVLGTESGVSVNNIFVGNIITNNAGVVQGFHIHRPGGTMSGHASYDSLGFGNPTGDFEANSCITYTNCTHANPLYTDRSAKNFRPTSSSPAKGKIQADRYGYVPPLDIEGNPRTTADAGCYRVV